MKKKVRDLSWDEIRSICMKFADGPCRDCPLNFEGTGSCVQTDYHNLFRHELDREIEVEECQKN